MEKAVKVKVKSELNELNAKIVKLDEFIRKSTFKKLSTENQKLLKEQRTVMEKYADILIKRLKIN